MKLSNPDKIWFPKSKITKEEVVEYYKTISSYFLKHIKNHLIVLHRFPEGINQESFYQKQIPDYFPAYIKNKTINLKKGGVQTLVLIENKKSLIYLVNQATLTFHSWLSTTKNVDHPDKIVFDFDPATNDLKNLRRAVREMKNILENYNLVPFLMTTGSKGYHVVVPIKPTHSFDTVHEFAKQRAQELAAQFPLLLTTSASLKDRKNKIFIDYLRNSYGQTSVAPYSVRALEKAPVATPIEWLELSKTTPQKYNIGNIFKRLETKGDVWKNFEKNRKSLKIKNL